MTQDSRRTREQEHHMKRTAADFLAEARGDDPYELALPGRKTPLQPKPWSHFTHDEQHQLTMAQFKWGKAIESGDVVGYPQDEQPFFVELKIRFGKDFDAFWKAASEWPKAAVDKLVREVDAHYDPTPADDKSAEPESEAGKAPLRSVGR